MREFLFTSESVSEGHPDKIADQISDGILDAIFEQDPHARVAAETLVSTGLVVLAGEITTTARIAYNEVARRVIAEIGYTDSSLGFDANSCAVMLSYNTQSPDIAQGVNEGQGLDLEQGAGDQGLMFGYACSETDDFMPAPIHYAHRLMERQAQQRKSGQLPWLRPDAKSQVTTRYREDGHILGFDTVVISTQHSEEVSHKTVEEAVIETIIRPVVPAQWLKNTRFLINPTGKFVIGGPHGDCGLTGRKIIVDTYGGAAPHGGGAFSGKDPSKVDRSAAYAARHVAKNLVASGLAGRAQVQIAYAIGVAKPVSIMVDSFGTSALSNARLEQLVREHFDLRPKGIIQALNLLRPIYRKTAAYGHFGRTDLGFPWEQTDRAEALKNSA